MQEACCEGQSCAAWAASVANAPVVPEREASVLAELAREPDGQVAFQGLKRSLDLHQQVLARTLKRLAKDGLVAKDRSGYRLTEQGFAALCASDAVPARATPREVLSVVQAVLPPHVASKDVADRLERRWFKGLRWYGRTDGPGETTLTWVAPPSAASAGRGDALAAAAGDDARVVVRLSGGAVNVEIEMGEDGAGFAAVRGILSALAEAYGPVPRQARGPMDVTERSPGFVA